MSGESSASDADGASPSPPVHPLRAATFVHDSIEQGRSVLYNAGLLLRTGDASMDARIADAAPEIIARLRLLVDCVVAVEPEDAPPDLEPLARAWALLGEAVHALPSRKPAADARDAFFAGIVTVYTLGLKLLEHTPRKPSLTDRLTERAEIGMRWLDKNATTVVSTVGVGYLVFDMRQVAAFFSAAWLNGLMLTYLFLPLLLVGHRQLRFDRDLATADGTTGLIRPWDIGGVAFRKLDPLVVAPRHFPAYRDDSPWPGIFVTSIGHKLKRYFGMLVPACAGLFLLGGWVFDDFDLALTALLIATVLASILGFARLIDYWDNLDPRNVRLMVLVGLIALLLLANLPQGRVPVLGISKEVAFLLVLGVGSVINLATVLRDRRAALTRILLALSLIGMLFVGSKMAFTPGPWSDDEAESIERLPPSAWPFAGDDPVVVIAASGGGSRAALYAAHTFERLHFDAVTAALGPHVHAISSVSGGSLANAIYISRRLAPDALEEGAMVAGAGQDFIRPTVLGFLSPFSGRGASIEAAFADAAGVGDLRLSSVRDAWSAAAEAGAKHPPCPMPLFNTVTLDTNAVVISPLAAEAYELVDDGLSIRADARDEDDSDGDDATHNDYVEFVGSEAPTWVFYRDAIYGLEDLLERYDPALVAAVRASANFPFGFPLVEVETDQPRFFSPFADDRRAGEPGRVFLTDGGVLSNSGMWPLYHLLRNRLDVLKRRGVVLLVVNASGMPTKAPPRDISGLWATIQDQVPLGANMHRRMFDELNELYQGRLAIHQIDLTPTVAANIETSWMLPDETQDALAAIFETRWAAMRDALAADWKALRDPAVTLPETPTPRLPLD